MFYFGLSKGFDTFTSMICTNVNFMKICSLHSDFNFQVYKKKTEAAKKDYLKALAAYRASLVSKVSFCTYLLLLLNTSIVIDAVLITF